MSRDQNPYSVAMKVREIEARTADLIAAANLKAEVVRQRMAADLNAGRDGQRAGGGGQRADHPGAPGRRRSAGGPQGRRGGLARLVVRHARLQLPVAAQGDRRPGRHAVAVPAAVRSRPASSPGRRSTPSTAPGRSSRSRSATRSSARTPPPAPWPSSPSSSSTTTRPARPCGSRSRAATRWCAASITGSGGPTSAGPWPASSSRATSCAPSAAWSGSPRSSPTRPSRSTTSTWPAARTFFAGTSDLLVHDNTLPDHRLKPFDALPVVEVAGPNNHQAAEYFRKILPARHETTYGDCRPNRSVIVNRFLKT